MTGGNFLAYSCAAARDFHPLPSPHHDDEDARTKGVLKELKQSMENLIAEWPDVKESGEMSHIIAVPFLVSVPDEAIDQRNPLRSRHILQCAQSSALTSGGAFAWVLVSWFSEQL